MAVALLLAPAAWAMALVPEAIAQLDGPLDVAVAPAPDAIAKLFAVLLQPVPALIPLIDAQAAFASPAPANVAAAKPDATAPSRMPPGSLCVEMRWLIGCPSR